MKKRLPCIGFCLFAAWALLGGTNSVQITEAYRKAWYDPALVKRMDEGIEQNRKGKVTLRVTDAKGKPLAGAKLSVRQKTHVFLFGCNA